MNVTFTKTSPVLPPLSVTTHFHCAVNVTVWFGMVRVHPVLFDEPLITEISVSPDTYCHE